MLRTIALGLAVASIAGAAGAQSAVDPTVTTASDALCHGPGDTRITTAHRATGRTAAPTGRSPAAYDPERSRVTTSPRSRSNWSARDAVNEDTSYVSAMSRTAGSLPTPHSPARNRVAS